MRLVLVLAHTTECNTLPGDKAIGPAPTMLILWDGYNWGVEPFSSESNGRKFCLPRVFFQVSVRTPPHIENEHYHVLIRQVCLN